MKTWKKRATPRKTAASRASKAGVHRSDPPNEPHFDIAQLAELAVDVWRIERRAKRDSASDAVLVACERAQERVAKVGLEVKDLTGSAYDTNMKVRVLQHDAGPDAAVIEECLTPAVYFAGELVREAEVITRGGD